MHRVGVGQRVRHQRVTALVVGDHPLLALGDQPALALRARHHAVDRLLELREADELEVVARREQRGLVHEVGEIGTGEPGRAARDHVEVDAGRERLLLAVHREDRLASLEIGTVDHDLAVEATRAQQRGIEDVGTVGGREQDHALLLVEAVHLHQQLVERLLTLVVATAEPGTAVTSDRVDLVDEHDRGCGGLRLLEEVAHARCADADEHLHEVGAADREERHPGLTRDRLGEQCLAGARRPVEQHALRDLGAHLLELGGRLEELLDLLELLDRFVEAGDVGERDLRLVLRRRLGARLAEAHDAAAAALHLPEHPHEHQREQDEGQQPVEQAQPCALALVVGVELADPGVDDVLREPAGVLRREVDRVVGAVLQLAGDRVVLVVDGRGRDLARFEVARVPVERDLLAARRPS